MRTLLKLLVPVAVFAVTLAILTSANGRDSAPASLTDRPGPASIDVAPGASTEETIDATLEALEAEPGDAALHASLGDLYYQRGRETADGTFNEKALEAYRAALRLDSRNAQATLGLGTLALVKHQFADGLRYGQRALRQAPATVAPYTAIVDGLVELGRYDDAGRALQRMVSLKPNLASYSRVSYYRELHGDVEGALEALQLAISAGGGNAESVAYVEFLVGNLEFQRGRLDAAEAAFRAALRRAPEQLNAKVGLASVTAARGDLDQAISLYEEAVEVSAVHEYNVLLLEAQLADGRTADAERTKAAIREVQDFERNELGANTDAELAIFEAEHGSPDRAVELGRAAVRDAPSTGAADAYTVALTSAGRGPAALRWARKALRLGTKDPLFLYHAGMAAREAGNAKLARRWLTAALDRNPRFSPWHAPKAEAALRSLPAT